MSQNLKKMLESIRIYNLLDLKERFDETKIPTSNDCNSTEV